MNFVEKKRQNEKYDERKEKKNEDNFTPKN